MRSWLLPAVLRPLLRRKTVRKRLFQRVSQIGISYRGLPPNSGKAGSLQAGDRLPWVKGDGLENFLPLRALNWQVHLHDTPSAAITDFCAERNIILYTRPWGPESRAAGLQRRAVYLVRPDGHIAFLTPDENLPDLRRFWDSMHSFRAI
jgi:hypothetical protein